MQERPTAPLRLPLPPPWYTYRQDPLTPRTSIATTLAYMQARPTGPSDFVAITWHIAGKTHCPSGLQSPPLWRICKQGPLPPRLRGHHMAHCRQDPLAPPTSIATTLAYIVSDSSGRALPHWAATGTTGAGGDSLATVVCMSVLPHWAAPDTAGEGGLSTGDSQVTLGRALPEGAAAGPC